MASEVEMRNVSVAAPAGATILRDVSWRAAPQESVALIGRSGAGKTTTLRLINGLVNPTRGQVLVDGADLAQTDLITLRRRTGYIIQGSGLFPHRTVYENVATVPRLLGWNEDKTRAAATELMEKLAIPFDRFAHRKPRSLSGGEQQRAGIARALIANPPLLLCDEPFGALDPIVRRELQQAFVALRADATIVFVTHDLNEALRVAQKIVLFDGGTIVAECATGDFLRCDLPLARELVASATLAADVA
ncbi:MAG TPA: ATP-binding cassette domain-containing protein [Thermoanaerobaculia bacterium]|nr:ATP-binding cassette domain-containing protein [Thermoanaerobaculia bacterium]